MRSSMKYYRDHHCVCLTHLLKNNFPGADVLQFFVQLATVSPLAMDLQW